MIGGNQPDYRIHPDTGLNRYLISQSIWLTNFDI